MGTWVPAMSLINSLRGREQRRGRWGRRDSEEKQERERERDSGRGRNDGEMERLQRGR